MDISSRNSMLDHLLESSHRDNSNKWFNIGDDEEITQYLCCADDNCRIKKSPGRRGFTNFSVTEILKPDYAPSSSRGYDSDGTYCTESGDTYSSCDEIHEYDSSPCQSPARAESVQSSAVPEYDHPSQPDAFSIFERFRQQYDEDGYSSSDSEAALDLRIARKKTPPKMTGEIPAWVFCTRYSDRPSTGRRARRRKQPTQSGRKRTRTAFNDIQLQQLNIEFERDPYLSETRRQALAGELELSETNVKIWFQNRRAKLKKTCDPHPLAEQLKAEGLYNHKSIINKD